MRQVIFNVGAGLSSYVEVNGHKILIDLGSSPEFNPITDFLVPLYRKRGDERSQKDSSKRYYLDQCVISHPHKDHLSAAPEFNKMIYPELITCPNDKKETPSDEKVNWEKIGNQNEPWMIAFLDMLKGRTPPLRSIDDECVHLFWLKPKYVERNDTLSSESYQNNISIVAAITYAGYTILLPGDLQKEGMSALINGGPNIQGTYWVDNLPTFNEVIGKGVDVLVAPHHGLRSSFSTELFNHMKGGRTRSLNVVSEKTNTDDSRNVDTRYSSTDFCSGDNSLKECQVKTSRGHVAIDYSEASPKVSIITSASELIDYFMA